MEISFQDKDKPKSEGTERDAEQIHASEKRTK